MTVRAVQLLGSFQRQLPTYYQLHHSDRLYECLLWFNNTVFVAAVLTWIPWLCLIAFSL